MKKEDIKKALIEGKYINVDQTWTFWTYTHNGEIKGSSDCADGCCYNTYDNIEELLESIDIYSNYDDLRDVTVLD